MHVIYLCVNVMHGSVTQRVEWTGMLQFGIAAKSNLSRGIPSIVGMVWDVTTIHIHLLPPMQMLDHQFILSPGPSNKRSIPLPL
jgi:hypothetical protein